MSESSGKGIAFITERFPDSVVEQEEHHGQASVTVAADVIHDVIQGLRDEAGYAFLDDLTAVDYLDRPDVEGRFRVVYHLLDMKEADLMRVKALVTDEDVEVPTVSDLFGVADWLEREVFDMFGIRFAGHPDLKRILMPEDWEGFPCRRDYPVEGHLPIFDPMRERDFARDVTGEQP
ncbi:MAG: NADH-quinone oxidoreductase subunit C [Planctomycetota bacterium]|jgi:NADH-quinone oxidoreductase subunit C